MVIVLIVIMQQNVQKIIRKKLSHLDSAERDQALNGLILVGLKHYRLLYADQDVNLQILEYLCGKSILPSALCIV